VPNAGRVTEALYTTEEFVGAASARKK